jgi:hypothetical protein
VVPSNLMPPHRFFEAFYISSSLLFNTKSPAIIIPKQTISQSEQLKNQIWIGQPGGKTMFYKGPANVPFSLCSFHLSTWSSKHKKQIG